MCKLALGTTVICLAVAAWAAGADHKGPDAQSLDGSWVVICFEKGGQPQLHGGSGLDATQMKVTGAGDTLTCIGGDGALSVTFKVEFGANNTVRVSETAADGTAAPAARVGVCVRTREYLAVSLNTDPVPDGQPLGRWSLILKRVGGRSSRGG